MDQPSSPIGPDVSSVPIEEEMKRSYLDYAMSVIVSRALPDVRDGLKPVHRRILYSMSENGYEWNRPYRKSARVVGDVMGRYHPHGDQAIYDAMVRMAQDFSMRLELIDGQGNFGSMDGDPPAAMRYTEVRLDQAASPLLLDIDKDTVDFIPNYDETTNEPVVLPARYPNLLVNGAGGIAVGMATNIPTHNLGEVIDACCAYLDNPGVTIAELMRHLPGPDFPTGGEILGKVGIHDAYTTGRGSVIVRGKAEIVDGARETIIITEIPYQVNKARLVERIAELVNERQIEGIADLRDESDRDGVRVVVEVKRDASADVILNQLYRFTPLQTSFGVNMLAINAGRPELLSLRDVIVSFVAFREEVIRRRTLFELRKARERAHLLIGLAVAVANIDPVIALIRAAPDPATARQQLMDRRWPAEQVESLIRLVDEPGHEIAEDGTFTLSEAQARGILELRLQRLTGLEREKIREELEEIAGEIRRLLSILENRDEMYAVLRAELVEVREKFATPRRTQLVDGEFETDIEALIQREDMVVTISHGGYIKRTPLSTYRAQRRGGRGRAGMSTRGEDFVSRVFVANTHTPVLFFTTRGIAYQLKVYRLPLGNPQSRGKALVNLLPVETEEAISAAMPMPDDESLYGDLDVMFATSNGHIRRNSLADFVNVKSNGKIAMKLENSDEENGARLIAVKPCRENQDVLLVTRLGKCIRFPVSGVRRFTGRSSPGVRGIQLADGDEVISMSILNHVETDLETREAYLREAASRRRAATEDGDPEAVPGAPVGLSMERFTDLEASEEFILSVTELGFGKRTSSYEYRVTSRGGKGIDNVAITDRNGPVAAAFPVLNSDQVMLVTNGGQLIRSPVNDIRIAGRKTQGVTLLRVGEEEKVVSVTVIAEDGEDADEIEEGDQGGEPDNV